MNGNASKPTRFGFVLCVLLAGCGGGSLSGTSNYAYAPTVLNSRQSYTLTTKDTLGNVIGANLLETVQAINPDGSFTLHRTDPAGNEVLIGDTNYSVLDGSTTFDNTGLPTYGPSILTTGASEACSYSRKGAPLKAPVDVGSTWSLNVSITCNSTASQTYSQQGLVHSLESVVVPVGVFTAFKINATTTWREASGVLVTESSTSWRDADNQTLLREVKYIHYDPPVPPGAGSRPVMSIKELTQLHVSNPQPQE